MGREVRRVPKDWQHPKDERGRFIPLREAREYADALEDWNSALTKKGTQGAIEWCGGPPDLREYMPRWTEAEADHLMMYEDTSEGTPISPAFKTPEELARWLADNNASAFGDMTCTYEQWLGMIRRGWAPSGAIVDGKMIPGAALKAAEGGHD